MNEKQHNPNLNNNEHTSEAGEYNTIDAVESVYPADAIDVIDTLNAKDISLPVDHTGPELTAANEEHAYADIFCLSSARRAKHDRSLERRASKSRLTDRRAAARLNADGEAKPDRREANRLANIHAIRQSGLSSSS